MFERGSKKETLPRACVVVLALSVPPVLWLWDLSPEIFAGCDAYGYYGCTEVACFGLEVTTDQGFTWREGTVYVYGLPGSTILVHTRTLLGVISGSLEGWQFSVRHDGSAVTAAGGAFDLMAAAKGQISTLQCGAAPDFEDTRMRPCGYTQGVAIDFDATACTVSAPAEVVTSTACYRVTFPMTQGVYAVTLRFTDDVGDPPIESIVTQGGESEVPCKYDLTLTVYSTTSYYPTTSYCPLYQQGPVPCPPPGGGGGGGGGGQGEVDCADGVDNDSDGDTDCRDSECCSDPSCKLCGKYCQDPPGPPVYFLRADANDDGAQDLSAAVRILRYLFVDSLQYPIDCLASADTNNDGKLNITNST